MEHVVLVRLSQMLRRAGTGACVLSSRVSQLEQCSGVSALLMLVPGQASHNKHQMAISLSSYLTMTVTAPNQPRALRAEATECCNGVVDANSAPMMYMWSTLHVAHELEPNALQEGAAQRSYFLSRRSRSFSMNSLVAAAGATINDTSKGLFKMPQLDWQRCL